MMLSLFALSALLATNPSVVDRPASLKSVDNSESQRNVIDWLKTVPKCFVNPKINVQKSSLGDGFGLYVSDPVSPNELLMTIPCSSCISFDTAKMDEDCGERFQQFVDYNGVGARVVALAGYLAKEYIKSEYLGEEGYTGQWASYLATLPFKPGQNEQDHILWWEEGEVQDLLKGSKAYDEANAFRKDVSHAVNVMHELIWPSIFKYTNGKSELDIHKILRGAFVSILSRSVFDEMRHEDKATLMVPLLDILQHTSGTPNVQCYSNGDSIEVRAKSSVSSYTELLISYASCTYTDLPENYFTRYGFIPGHQTSSIRAMLNVKDPLLFDGSLATDEMVTNEDVNSIVSPENEVISWLKKVPECYVNPSIDIESSPIGDGFGLFVVKPVDANELLFSIPTSLCVSYLPAMRDEECGEQFQDLVKMNGPGARTVAVAGFLAKEFLRCEYLADDYEGKYAAYLQSLPLVPGKNEQEHVLWWPEDEFRSLLQGSIAYDEALGFRQDVNSAVKALSDIIYLSVYKAKVKQGFVKEGNDLNDINDAIRGAFVTILSRSFYDDTRDENERALLVPLLDMLQHTSDSANVQYFTNGDNIELRAKWPMYEKTELMISYSYINEPWNFFTRYGFVPGQTKSVKEMLKEKDPVFFPNIDYPMIDSVPVSTASDIQENTQTTTESKKSIPSLEVLNRLKIAGTNEGNFVPPQQQVGQSTGGSGPSYLQGDKTSQQRGSKNPSLISNAHKKSQSPGSSYLNNLRQPNDDVHLSE